MSRDTDTHRERERQGERDTVIAILMSPSGGGVMLLEFDKGCSPPLQHQAY